MPSAKVRPPVSGRTSKVAEPPLVGWMPQKYLRKNIGRVGSPGVVHFASGAETFPIGFVAFEHGAVAGQIVEDKSAAPGTE